MKLASVINPAAVDIKLGTFGIASANAISDPSLLPRVQEYRRLSGGRMHAIGRHEIRSRIPESEFHVSRKVDGEFTVLVYRDDELFTVNPGGTVRVGMPWLEETRMMLRDADIKEAIVVGELYAKRDDANRPRVHDVVSVARQPKDLKDLQRLQFAVFDLISINNVAVDGPFAAVWNQITRIFTSGKCVHPIESQWVSDRSEIDNLYQQWVIDESAEGIVVRSDDAGRFKIKPQHTLDAVVIGFSESTGDRVGLLHDLLIAVRRPDGTLHVLSKVGGGFSEEQRRAMLCDLKDMVVESEYAEVNSDHAAYQMVEPQWVVEVNCLDFVSQSTRGGPVQRPVLEFDRNGKLQYRYVRQLPLASVISPQFVRRRDDKTPSIEETRISQISDLVEVPLADVDAKQIALPASQLLRREVFTKELKGQTMIRKFLMWSTNKSTEENDFPAFVLHYTDFSPNRKTQLEREVRVSSSQTQIEELFESMKSANIKSGWKEYSIARADTTEPPLASSQIVSIVEPLLVTEPALAEATNKPTRAKKAVAKSPAEPKPKTPRKRTPKAK